MTEIQVIKTFDDDVTLTNEEREIQIKKMGIKFNLPEYVFRSFIELDNEYNNLIVRYQIPTIKSFLLRKLLSFDIIYPIITLNISDQEQIIELSFDKLSYCSDFNSEYVIPTNQQFIINEIKINPTKTFIMIDELAKELFPFNFMQDIPSISYIKNNNTYDSRRDFHLKYLYSSDVFPDYFIDRFIKLFNEDDDIYLKLLKYLIFISKYAQTNECKVAITPFFNIEKQDIFLTYGDKKPETNLNNYELELIDKITKLSIIPIVKKNIGVVWNDLKNAQLLDLYKFLYIQDTKKIEAHIIEKTNKLLKYLFIKEKKWITINKNKEIINIEHIYRWIYIKLYGFDKYSKVEDFLPILDQITETEKNNVLSNYEIYQRMWNSSKENDCPHIKIYQKILQSSDTKSIKYFKELKKYYGERKPGEYIKCSLCKFNLICPHLNDYYDMLINRKHHNEIREKMADYASGLSKADFYYCKICGERLIQTTESIGIALQRNEDGSIRVVLNYDDAITSFVWKVCSQVVSSVIEFPTIQTSRTINRIITEISYHIIPLVKDKEIEIMKSRTITETEIQLKMRLFTNIYIYALLVYTMIKNPGKVFFKESPTTNPKIIIGAAIDLLYTTQNTIINKLEGITKDLVRIYLAESYKKIAGSFIKLEEEKILISDIIIGFITDPFYIKLLQLKNLFIAKNNKLSEYLQKKIDIIDISKVINKTADKLQEEKYIFNNIKKDEFIRDDASVDIKITKWDFYQIDKLLSGIYNKIFNASFSLWFNQIFDRNFDDVVFNNGEVDKKKQVFYDSWNEQIKNTILYNDIYIAKIMFMVSTGRLCKDFNVPYFTKDDKLRLGTTFGKKAHRHEWTIFIFNDKKSATLKEIIDAINNKDNTFLDKYVIDRECSICGQKFSDDGLSNIKDIVKQYNEIQLFFNYFKYKCPAEPRSPVDYYHDWKDISNNQKKCVKCKITSKEFENKDIDYYKKYKHKLVYRKLEIKFPERIDVMKLDKFKQVAEKFSFDKIVLSQFAFNIKKKEIAFKGLDNAIINLGLTEGTEYESILNGKSNPADEDNENLYPVKINAIQNYIQLLITYYDLIKNFVSINQLPPELLEFVQEKQPKKEVFVEDISKNYDEIFEKMKRLGKSKKKQSNFLIEFLLKTINELLTNKELCNFAKWFINIMFKFEKDMALLTEKEIALLSTFKKDDYIDKIDQIYTPDEVDKVPDEDDMNEKFDYYDVDYDGYNDEDNNIFDL
jgi:ribosomal protein L7Ae-like RNA K-turn-binding protein